MFNTKEVVEESIKELNYERENEARDAIRGFIRKIVHQQEIIAKASKEITLIQESIRAIKVETVEVSISL